MRRILLAIVMILMFSAAVRAELNFCNGAPLTVEAAVGEPAGGNQWRTRGWFKLKPGECGTIISGDLTNRYYYAYASTPGEKWKWEGDLNMCTSWQAFNIVHGECEADMIRKFSTIDTGDSKSFNYWFTCPDCLDPSLVRAIRLNIPFLEGLANGAAPLSYRTNDWQDVGPADIQYGVSRSPFSLRIDGNQVSISARLYYWLSVSHTRFLGIRTGLASCGIDEPEPYADVTLTTIFGITEDGKIVSKTRVTNLSFPVPCNLTIFNIDGAGYVQQFAAPQLDRLASTIDGRIGEIDVSRAVNVKNLY